jgi:membrane protease YdiL (CAAX protease family)
MRYLYVLALMAAVAAGALCLEFVFRVTGSSWSIYDRTSAGLVALYVLALILVGLFMRFFAPIDALQYHRLYLARWRVAARGFVTMFAFSSLFVLAFYAVLALHGEVAWSQHARQHVNPADLSQFIVGILVACLLATTEEILFRGFVLNYLRWNASRRVTFGAILCSSLIFASVHNIEDPLAWFTADLFPLFVGLLILGVVLAIIYLETGSLWCSIGFHAGLVAFGEVFLGTGFITIDFKPWWMGGTGDLRTAPLVWVLFIVMAILVIVARKWLYRHLAVERPFVGMPQIARS